MPHAFTWAPAQGARHASLDPAPGAGYPTGMTIETLCGRQVTADNDTYAWLWETCPNCDARTRDIVGAPTIAECQAKATA